MGGGDDSRRDLDEDPPTWRREREIISWKNPCWVKNRLFICNYLPMFFLKIKIKIKTNIGKVLHLYEKSWLDPNLFLVSIKLIKSFR